MRLWRRVVGHSHLPGTNQAVGMSMRVGSKIFSIVEDLSFVYGQSRGYEQWLREGQVLHLPHRPKMLEEGGGRLRS